MVDLIIPIVLGYLVVGLLFGVFFFVKGAKLLDPVVRESSTPFRVLIFPASVALWPLLASMLMKRRKVTA